ncbi:MAG: transcription antitermination factor NusB, partial [Gemmatimonadales bacterium]|nr:transcription antitermination factor NusB [Gemmatimonadales bacterium]
HELAAGVLRRQATLDALLAPLAARGWDAVAPALQDLLRVAAYQLVALDRVPAHAAVATAVALAREAAGERPAGFVNAVLRRVASRRREAAISTAADDGRSADGLARRYSHPAWLVARWLARFGADATERLLEANNRTPVLVAQPARQDIAQLAAAWHAAGIDVERAPWDAGLLPARRRPADLPGFAEGGFVVQDAAQALVVRAAAIPPGALVYDACAAPGGKTIALGRTARLVVAGERDPGRAARLAANLARAGAGTERVVVADARRPPVAAVDAALLDAPCLGTGTFARHPDARWRVTPEALDHLARRQAALLRAVAAVVRPGGLLVYATCSLEPEENVRQVDAFLAEQADFAREPAGDVPGELRTAEGDLLLLPHRDGTDGGYCARLRRR